MTNEKESTIKVDRAMELLAALDTLEAERYSEQLIDRIDRAVNSHEEIVELLKISLDAFNGELNKGGIETLKDRINIAIKQAEGK